MVYLVGAGPGDAGLITVRGRELISRADVVMYDRLASEKLLDAARGDAELIYVGKEPGRHSHSQKEINELLVAKAREGKSVVRLKGGDPFVFGRGGEEAIALGEAEAPFEIVPGVTAGIAAPAAAGIPVTHRGISGAVALVTAHGDPTKEASDLDLDALANWKGTLVFYMGVSRMDGLLESLIARGLNGNTPAAVVSRGSTPRQHTVLATAATLAARALEENVTAPAVIVIGAVATLRERIEWFEKRPLFGRRVVVTRARAQASRLAERLGELGAEVIEAPTISILPPEDDGPLNDAAVRLGEFDWVVFTSANAVEALFAAMERAALDARAFGRAKVCTIGPATAAALETHGIRGDAQPDKFLSAEIAPAMEKLAPLGGAKILRLRSDISPPDLAEEFASRGANVADVIAYRTCPNPAAGDVLRPLMEAGGVSWITFTSSSTVRNLLAVIDAAELSRSDARLASIGPVTSATLREAGLEPCVETKTHTVDGLVDAIMGAELS